VHGARALIQGKQEIEALARKTASIVEEGCTGANASVNWIEFLNAEEGGRFATVYFQLDRVTVDIDRLAAAYYATTPPKPAAPGPSSGKGASGTPVVPPQSTEPETEEDLQAQLAAIDRQIAATEKDMGDLNRDIGDLDVQIAAKQDHVTTKELALQCLKSVQAGNYAAAASACRQAADLGEVHAQAALAEMYRFGNGVARSDQLALAWYQKAAAQGHAGALNGLRELEAQVRGRQAGEEAKPIGNGAPLDSSLPRVAVTDIREALAEPVVVTGVVSDVTREENKFPAYSVLHFAGIAQGGVTCGFIDSDKAFYGGLRTLIGKKVEIAVGRWYQLQSGLRCHLFMNLDAIRVVP
jgi:hypothetical protein